MAQAEAMGKSSWFGSALGLWKRKVPYPHGGQGRVGGAKEGVNLQEKSSGAPSACSALEFRLQRTRRVRSRWRGQLPKAAGHTAVLLYCVFSGALGGKRGLGG